ncbi:hypothetical protein [Leptospira alexanderi]|nr:hypothetical protein [Leptospira alexanderi]
MDVTDNKTGKARTCYRAVVFALINLTVTLVCVEALRQKRTEEFPKK